MIHLDVNLALERTVLCTAAKRLKLLADAVVFLAEDGLTEIPGERICSCSVHLTRTEQLLAPRQVLLDLVRAGGQLHGTT